MPHLDMRFDFSTDRKSERAAEEAPMRILLIGDFGGRSTLASGQTPPIPARLHRVDVDNIDQTFARIAPQVPSNPADATSAHFLVLRSLDDLHPDQLFKSAEAFDRWRDVRARLRNRATVDAAVNELRDLLGSAIAGSEQGPRGIAQPGESDSATAQRLLGDATPASGPSAATPTTGINQLIQRAVAPHVVADWEKHVAIYLAAVDAELSSRMRQVLHSHGFRAVEIAWRGLQWLVSRLELDEDLQLYILDTTRNELAADLKAHATDIANSAIATALRATAGNSDPFWALLTTVWSFGPEAEELDLLEGLGRLGASLHAPTLGAAASALVGCAGAGAWASPRGWRPLVTEAAERWDRLRRSEVASSIGLVAPRFLLRLPFGAATDAIDSFAFEEQPAGIEHDTLCWAPGSLAVASALSQAYAQNGWDGVGDPSVVIEDLPAYTFRRDGETQMLPCAEAWVGEESGDALLARGLMPLLSDRRLPRVRLARIQSIAEPAKGLKARWG